MTVRLAVLVVIKVIQRFALPDIVENLKNVGETRFGISALQPQLFRNRLSQE